MPTNTKPSGTIGDTQKTMTISATSFRGCNRFSPLLIWAMTCLSLKPWTTQGAGGGRAALLLSPESMDDGLEEMSWQANRETARRTGKSKSEPIRVCVCLW